MNKKLRLKILEKFDHQVDFALALGIKETTVSRVVRGRQSLSPRTQKEWAEFLGCKPEEIFETEHHTG